MPDREPYLVGLNAQQAEVVNADDGPLLVVAGAGSGKTRTLTSRLAALVAKGVPPRNVLLMTFTNRAAREMLARTGYWIGDAAHSIWGGTFHSIGVALLRRYGYLLDIPPNFTILDREDSGKLYSRAIESAEVNAQDRSFPSAGKIGQICGLSRNLNIPLQDTISRFFSTFTPYVADISLIDQVYTKLKKQAGVLDFDDLLVSTLTLLEDYPDVAEELSSHFVHVLVDEYQDTNTVQARIVERLAASHQNICAVGDDAQAIYSFRGASVANMLSFPERYPDARVYRLETNYRSSPEILGFANATIMRSNNCYPKELASVKQNGCVPEVVGAADPSEQAAMVVRRVHEGVRKGYKPEDIAILYRSHHHSLQIQLELRQRQLPFYVRGGVRFFEQVHIKDILGALRILNNARDEVALLRTVRLLQGVGEKTAEKVREVFRNTEAFPETVLYDIADQKSGWRKAVLPRLRKLADAFDTMRKSSGPAEMIHVFLQSFYQEYATQQFTDDRRRIEDIETVAGLAGESGNLEDFLANAMLESEYNAGEIAPQSGEETPDESPVVLSTIHQAKGLEWKMVLIPWLAEGHFPAGGNDREKADTEEERRIFHVASTRAEDELVLFYPSVSKTRKGEVQPQFPSRFLEELREEEVAQFSDQRAGPRREEVWKEEPENAVHFVPSTVQEEEEESESELEDLATDTDTDADEWIYEPCDE